MISQPIMAASAVAPCTRHERAIEHICAGLADLVLGAICPDEIQICPQHAGLVCEAMIDRLMGARPGTRFRLHAGPRVSGDHRHAIISAANAREHEDQVRRLAQISRRMNAAGYTIHAGKQSEGSLATAFDTIHWLSDLFGCPVGIEGLYPAGTSQGAWLLSSWREYEAQLTAKVPYALDLSHLNILARREGRQDSLVLDLLASPLCLELHLSSNSGRRDEHLPLDPLKPEWWLPMLHAANHEATIFYEGVLVEPHRPTTLSG